MGKASEETTVMHMELAKVINKRSEMRWKITRLHGLSPEYLPAAYLNSDKSVYVADRGWLNTNCSLSNGAPRVGSLLTIGDIEVLAKATRKAETLLRRVLKDEQRRYRDIDPKIELSITAPVTSKP